MYITFHIKVHRVYADQRWCPHRVVIIPEAARVLVRWKTRPTRTSRLDGLQVPAETVELEVLEEVRDGERGLTQGLHHLFEAGSRIRECCDPLHVDLGSV